ncbi:hypothetical protein R3P38DRAFT_3546240 [Favolaschia claudopus]|uniref:Homeobox domain-containing protein n=1 Tax=Favolaschia claudopus TaxID=2862362 RepID=A0AAW0DXV1_9AGAR
MNQIPPVSSATLADLSTFVPPPPPPQPPKSRRPRNKARSVHLNNYYEKNPDPTYEQRRVLLAEINALPGEGNSTYQFATLNSWFSSKRRAALNTPNPLYPSLTPSIIGLLNIQWGTTPSEVRPDLYDFWSKSATFEPAQPADILVWLAEREAQEAAKAAAPEASTTSAPEPPVASSSTSTPAAPPPLHIDTSAPATNAGPRSHYRERCFRAPTADATGIERKPYYPRGLPTPSATSSPEPSSFPPFAPGASEPSSSFRAPSRSASLGTSHRYHPYPNTTTYRPPTPASSLKSESPLLTRLPSLPPSASTSPLVTSHTSLPPAPYTPLSASSSPLISARSSLPPPIPSSFHHTNSSSHPPPPSFPSFPPPPPSTSTAFASTSFVDVSPSFSFHLPNSNSIPPLSADLDQDQEQNMDADIDDDEDAPQPEPDLATRILRAVRERMDQPDSERYRNIKIPTNYREFEEAMAPWQDDMCKTLDRLKNISYDVPL